MVNVINPQTYNQDATPEAAVEAGFDVAPSRDPEHYGAQRVLRGVPVESAPQPTPETSGEVSPEDRERIADFIREIKDAGAVVTSARTATLADTHNFKLPPKAKRNR